MRGQIIKYWDAVGLEKAGLLGNWRYQGITKLIIDKWKL